MCNAMDTVLANCCTNGANAPWNQHVKVFTLEAHCMEFTIHARHLGNLMYEVYDVKMVSI